MSGNVDLGDPLHVHQSCTGCNYGVYKVDLTRSQNTMKEIEHPTYREFCLNCVVRIHERLLNKDLTLMDTYQIGRDLTFLELTIRNQEDLDGTMPNRGKAFKRYEPRE